jgi:hypothetical protein
MRGEPPVEIENWSGPGLKVPVSLSPPNEKTGAPAEPTAWAKTDKELNKSINKMPCLNLEHVISYPSFNIIDRLILGAAKAPQLTSLPSSGSFSHA